MLFLPFQGGKDSTPVRGALYEPTVLIGVSVEPRLSQRECFVVLNWAGRSFDGSPADLRDSEISRTRRL
jgi:hypothetical protein